MILRSQHQLSKTPEGHEAWRSQGMPVLQRQILSRLREPMTVQALLERLTNFDMSQVGEAITTLAGNGWVLVEDPAQPVDEAEDSELPIDAEDVLSDLMARRPVVETPVPVVEPGEEAVLAVSDEPLVAPETPVPDRGTPAQEHALLVAMGLIGSTGSEWQAMPVQESDDSSDTMDASDAGLDEDTPLEEPEPLDDEAEEAAHLDAAADSDAASSSSMDPRRQAVLRRIQMVTSTKRESRAALRAFRAKQEAEQAAADANSQRLREQEAAEREALSRK